MDYLEEKIEKLEKKVDLLTLAVERLEKMMLEAQPFLKIVNNLPFLK